MALFCNDRFLVYKFNCKKCEEFYIGQTSRPFKYRFLEHKRAIEKNRSSSALAEHRHRQGPGVSSILDFDLQILDQCRDALDNKLTEARFIKRLRPKINRKHELINF